MQALEGVQKKLLRPSQVVPQLSADLHRVSRNYKISNVSYHIWTYIRLFIYMLWHKSRKPICEKACSGLSIYGMMFQNYYHR